MSTARITHLIGGSPWTGVSERTSKVYNPATGEVTGELDLASAATVDEVVKVAHEASEGLGRRPRSPSVRRCCSPSASC